MNVKGAMFLQNVLRFKSSAALVSGLAVILAVAGCSSTKVPTPVSGSSSSNVTQKAVPKVRVDASQSKAPANTSTKPAQQAAPKAFDNPEPPKLTISQQGVNMRWVEQGQLRMSAKAREVQGDEISKTATLLDFSAQLYENGKLTASIKAPKAVVDTVGRVVTATGGVTLKSMERKTVVNASWMKWFSKEHRVVGNGGVNIVSEMGNIDAAAFQADTSLRTLSVKDSAKGLKY